MEQIKQQLFNLEDLHSAWFEEISRVIFGHPELGDQEFFSSQYLADEMKAAGFRVEKPYCGLETSFRCEYGDTDGPTIAFLAEYDALPGYGPNRSSNGHTCGHNWIAASTFAACVALKELKDATGFRGKIVYLGTPAEETTSRKITLIDRGAFNDIDAVYQMHLGEADRVDPAALAMTILWFEFIGLASHASGAPEKGINALDACNLTFAGINALRQHVTSDVRIHGIIKDGGRAPNIVPDHTLMEVYVRAADKDYLEEVIVKVCNCAKGASLMTGASVNITRDQHTTYNIRNNPLLVQLLLNNLHALGIEPKPTKDPLRTAVSTDIGNVSYAVPTCYTYMGTAEAGTARTHDAAFLDVADSATAHKQLHIAAKAMAAAALDLYLQPQLLKHLPDAYAEEYPLRYRP
ncbi:MAG: amidohydrolase [Lachnospirales bacterium]|jgi:amidohydrolase